MDTSKNEFRGAAVNLALFTALTVGAASQANAGPINTVIDATGTDVTFTVDGFLHTDKIADPLVAVNDFAVDSGYLTLNTNAYGVNTLGLGPDATLLTVDTDTNDSFDIYANFDAAASLGGESLRNVVLHFEGLDMLSVGSGPFNDDPYNAMNVFNEGTYTVNFDDPTIEPLTGSLSNLSFENDVNQVPLPGALALTGIGLLGFAGARTLNARKDDEVVVEQVLANTHG